MRRVILVIGVLFFTVGAYISSTAFAIEPDTEKILQMQKLKYELQERCGQRAEQVFKNELPFKVGFKLYRNHYNGRMNKCFMLIVMDNPPFMKIIYEVNEHGVYGRCEEGAKENGKDCKSGTWGAILKETMEE